MEKEKVDELIRLFEKNYEKDRQRLEEETKKLRPKRRSNLIIY